MYITDDIKFHLKEEDKRLDEGLKVVHVVEARNDGDLPQQSHGLIWLIDQLIRDTPSMVYKGHSVNFDIVPI